MIKMFHAGSLAAGEPGFWDANWEGGSLEEALRFCEQDPLRPVFERHVPPGSLVLEGGCGLGQYVVFYGRRGRRVVGLDFTGSTLSTVKRVEPRAVVCQADVATLPFVDGCFDAYFSGGVVEHFEEGPQRPLAEALRVLREDGRFLVSVPYSNPIRRIKAALGMSGRYWRTSGDVLFATERKDGRTFWQYAFTRREFGRLLEASGFRVVEVRPYALLWGLYELPGLAQVVRRLRSFHKGKGARQRSMADGRVLELGERSDRPARWLRTLLRRVFVEEDKSLPAVGRAVALCTAIAGNMILFICVKAPKGGAPAR